MYRHVNDAFFARTCALALAQHYFACDMAFIDAIKKDYAATPHL
jgi:hypothetical protein